MSDVNKKEVKTSKTSEKKSKKVQRISFSETYDKLQVSMPVLFFTCFSAVILMLMICAGVFFANIKGAEQVLVPNVVGKTLEDGIIELQIKQLYPKVSVRYSDDVSERGIILEQNPEAGSIVKGYNTITVVISRGDDEEVIPDYVGQSEESILKEDSDDSKKKALISFGDSSYTINDAPAGTVIAQYPAAGTTIYTKTKMQFVVSKGPSIESLEVPELTGKTVNDVLSAMSNGGIIYDVSYHNPTGNEISGTVTKQDTFGMKNKNTRVVLEMALDDSLDNEIVSGVFKETLCSYPVPVLMTVEAVTPEGTKFNVATFKHIGGDVTIPYSVPRGSVLTLYVLDDVKAETVVG